MSNTSSAGSTTGSRNQRPCPALNGVISSADCGARRGSQLDCPAGCPFYPFGTADAELWSKVEAEWIRKATEHVVARLGANGFEKLVRQLTVPLANANAEAEGAYFNALYLCLFMLPSPTGRTLADHWESEGWKGLNNDERVMMRYRRGIRPTVIEVQEVLDDRSLRCIDVLAADGRAFIVFDPFLAGQVLRFTRIFTLLAHYPHFSRVGGTTVQIPHHIWNSWRLQVESQHRKAAESRPDLDLTRFLVESLVSAARLVEVLQGAYRRELFEQMDLNQCLVRYRIVAEVAAVVSTLEQRPEFQRVDPPAASDLPPPYAFFRLQTPAELQGPAKEPGEAAVWVYPTVLMLEVVSKKRKDFARQLIEPLLGAQVTFDDEQIVNLSELSEEKAARERAVERASREVYTSTTAPVAAPAPRPTARKNEPAPMDPGMVEAHREHYRTFMDEPVPLLDGRTPRAVSGDASARPLLIELLKVHLHGLDHRNRAQGTQLDLDWMLDELGVPELKITQR